MQFIRTQQWVGGPWVGSASLTFISTAEFPRCPAFWTARQQRAHRKRFLSKASWFQTRFSHDFSIFGICSCTSGGGDANTYCVKSFLASYILGTHAALRRTSFLSEHQRSRISATADLTKRALPELICDYKRTPHWM